MATRQAAKVKEELALYLRQQQAKLEADANTATSEANETNRTLLNQLFVMAGGIVTLSSPIFIDRNIIGTLPLWGRQVLVGTIMAAITSVGAGFVQLYVERYYLQKGKILKSEASAKFGRGEIKTVRDLHILLNGIKQKVGKSSPDIFTEIQLVSLGVASLGFVTVMTAVLLLCS